MLTVPDGKITIFLIHSHRKIRHTVRFCSGMIYFYRLLFIPAFVLALPYYLWRMLRRGGYSHDFGHRFGLLRALPKKRAGVRRIWIQAVSVGEVRAIAPLLEALAQEPATEVVLTTTTSTGYAIVRDEYATLCLHTGIFPLDFWLFSALAWRRIRPDMTLLMEGELWPEHLHQAKCRKVPVGLINARLSDRSLSRYRRVAPLARRLLRHLSFILAGSEQDAARFAALGYPQERIHVTGNLKFDVSLPPVGNAQERQLQRQALGFPAGALVLLGSSTWPGEESLLVDAMEQARAQGIDCRLLLVPRHAERRAEIRNLLNRYPRHSHQFRSERKEALQPQLDIYVADTTGELAWLTQLADIAFIGKSLPPHTEGQSPIEAAAAALPITYGPGMSNFRPVCRSLEAANAALPNPDAAHTTQTLLHLLADADARARLSHNCGRWLAANQGATQRTLYFLSHSRLP